MPSTRTAPVSPRRHPTQRPAAPRIARAGSVCHALLLVLLVTTTPIVADIYVVDRSNQVLVFADDADGDVAPLRRIAGPDTLVGLHTDVALDLVNQELIVAGAFSINAFPLYADGNVAPIRRTSSQNHSELRNIGGIVVDPVHDEIIVTTFTYDGLVPHPKVLVFPRTVDGSDPMLRSFVPYDIGQSTGIALDLVRDELLLHGEGGTRVFSRTASGTPEPVRIVGTDQGGGGGGLFYDSLSDTLYATWWFQDRISSADAFPAAPVVPPLSNVSGPSTELHYPHGLTVTDTGEILVANWNFYQDGEASVAVFAPGSDGDAAPIRIIKGPNTGITFPLGVTSTRAVDGAAGHASPLPMFILVDDFESGDLSRWSMVAGTP